MHKRSGIEKMTFRELRQMAISEAEFARGLPRGMVEIEQQLSRVGAAIRYLEDKNASVPAELRELGASLQLELDELKGSIDNLQFIAIRLRKVLKSVEASIRAEQGKAPGRLGRGKSVRQSTPGRFRTTSGLGLPPNGTRLLLLHLFGQQIGIWANGDVLVETANYLIVLGVQLPLEMRPGAACFLSLDNNELSKPRRLGNGMYIRTDYPARSTVANARWLVQQMGFPAEALQVDYQR